MSENATFLRGLSNGGPERNEISHKGSLGVEDDAEYTHSPEKARDTTLDDEE